jgi:excisionase family DNA binding protein
MVAPLPALMTPVEVADYLRISKVTVYREIRAARLAHVRIRGHLRISEDALATYVADSSHAASSSYSRRRGRRAAR